MCNDVSLAWGVTHFDNATRHDRGSKSAEHASRQRGEARNTKCKRAASQDFETAVIDFGPFPMNSYSVHLILSFSTLSTRLPLPDLHL